MDRAEPDLEFEGLLKRQHTRVKYLQGSLMNALDLERVKVKLQEVFSSKFVGRSKIIDLHCLQSHL